MAEAQVENQVTSQEKRTAAHIIIAAWAGEGQNLQQAVAEKLTGNGNTYSIMNDAAIPHLVVDKAVEDGAKALICLMHSVADRRNVYRLIALCRRQQFYIPLILLGTAADPQYAQILALPEHGDLYQGGVYYCEDAYEMEQVLKQIILFTPPPVQHEHDHDQDNPFSCSDCGSCADNCALNQDW